MNKNISLVLAGVLCSIVIRGQDPIFHVEFGSELRDQIAGAIVFQDTLILAGFCKSCGLDGDADMALLKVSENGMIVQEKVFQENSSQTVYEVGFSDTLIILVGTQQNTEFGQMNFMVSFVNQYFELVNQVSWGESNSHDILHDVYVTDDNSIFVIGQKGIGSGAMGYVAKLDMMGEVEWEINFDNYQQSQSIGGASIDMTQDGDFLISYPAGSGGSECYLKKITSNGDVIWSKYYPEDRIFQIQHLEGGDILVSKPELAKLDSFGNIIWEDPYLQAGYSLAIADGILYVGQHSEYSATDIENSIFVTKLELDGAHVWTKKFVVNSTYSKAPVGLVQYDEHTFGVSVDQNLDGSPVEPNLDWLFILFDDFGPYLKVESLVSQPEVQVFPNPFREQTEIQLDQLDFLSGEIVLFDTQGRQIRQDSFNGDRYSLQRSGLKRGTYVYQILIDGMPPVTGRVLAL